MWDVVKALLERLAGWFKDLLLWLIGYLYELVNEVLDYLLNFCGDLLLGVLGTVKGHIPSDLEDTILATFEWLQYIDSWVPVSYAFKLVAAYYAIWLALGVYRTIKSFIPFIGS